MSKTGRRLGKLERKIDHLIHLLHILMPAEGDEEDDPRFEFQHSEIPDLPYIR